MHAASKLKGQQGYTMVDVLVAMAIIPFGLLSLGKFQSGLFLETAQNKTLSEALYAAEDKMEQLRAFHNDTEYNAIASGNDALSANPGSNASFNRSWTVTDHVSPDYKSIVMDVTWTDATNTTRSVSLSSYVSKTDPMASGKNVAP